MPEATVAHQTFTVRGMTCGHCVLSVTEAVSDLPGADAVSVDLATGLLSLDGPVPLDRDAVEAAVEEAGYTLVAGPP